MLIKKIAALVMSAAMFASAALTVSADNTEDIKFDLSDASMLNSWENAKVDLAHYDTSKLTEDSQVIIKYEATNIEAGEEGYSGEGEQLKYPVALSVQIYEENGKTGVWARIAPATYDVGMAVFDFDDISKVCAPNTYEDIDAFNVSATNNVKVKPISMTITKCKKGMYIEKTAEELAEQYKTTLIIVLAAALFIIVAMIVVFVIVLKKKTNQAYDVQSGRFVDKTTKW